MGYKIGILVTIANGFGKKGYYHSQEVGLAKYLTEQGHDVTVYKCVKGFEKTEENGFTIHYIPTWSVGVHGYMPIKCIDQDLDCLFSFADTQLFLPHIIRFCNKHHILFIPYVGVGHSAQRNTKSKILDYIFRKTTLQYYKSLPVFAKTPKAAEEFSSFGITNVRITPVGLDQSALKQDFRTEDRIRLRKIFGFEEDDIIISFVARMQKEKHPIDFVRVFQKIAEKEPRARLLAVGNGPLYDKVVDIMEKEHVRGKTFRRIPNDEIWEIHYISDFLLDLFEREIFGMALLEAVYYESSVAAIHAAGPDLILDGMQAHCLCDNYDQLVDWVLKGKPSESLLRKESEQLINTYSWKTCAEEIAHEIKKYKGEFR